MPQMTLRYRLDEIAIIAKALLESLPHKLWIFDAPMGVGKTTLISAICKKIGTYEVSSPTFSIVNDYDGGDVRVIHFDLYRLRDKMELIDIGFEEYLDGHAYIFIEWPELAMPFLPEAIHRIEMSIDGNYRILNVV